MGKLIAFPGSKPEPEPPAVINRVRRDELIAANMNIVPVIARHVATLLPPSFDVEDLEQSGYLGLIDAAEKFNEDLGVPFAAYARQRVRGAMLDSVRRRHWKDSTHEPVDDHAFDLQDTTLMNAEEIAARNEQIERVRDAIEKLDERDQTVLRMYYGNELHLGIVGAHLSVHPSRASQLHTRALARLRAILLTDAEWMDWLRSKGVNAEVAEAA